MGTNNINLDRVQTDDNFDFKNVLLNDTDDDDSTPYNNIGHNCRYFEQDEFQNTYKQLSKQTSQPLQTARQYALVCTRQRRVHNNPL